MIEVKIMLIKKFNLVQCIVLTVVIMSFFSCDALTDMDGGIYDPFLVFPNKSAQGSMEFYLDGELMSFTYCLWTYDNNNMWQIQGSKYRYEGIPGLVVFIGDGQVGNHNGNSYLGNEYLHITVKEVDSYVTYSSLDGSGNSTIYVSKNDGKEVEGTFAGTVCREAPVECLTITEGTFIAY